MGNKEGKCITRDAALAPILTLTGGQTPPLLAAIFQSACLDVTLGGIVRGVDEEAMTGAFLGAMIAQAPWWGQLLSASPPGCTWYRYRKSGGAADSETKTGGDLALLIRMDDGTARLAIIQAKRPGGETGRVLQVHRVAPAIDDRPREPQFVRLRAYGQSIAGVHGKENIAELSFVHYVLYFGEGPLAVSFDQLSEINKAYNEAETTVRYPDDVPSTSTRVPLTSVVHEPLVALLTRGCEPGAQIKGWLTMSESDAGGVIEKLGARVNVVEMSSARGVAPLVPEFRLKRLGVVMDKVDLTGAARSKLAEDWSAAAAASLAASASATRHPKNNA